MKKRFFEKYTYIFFIFMTGSFAGFVHENLLTILQGHFQLKQGLIYEPLIPIYGLGALVFYFVYKNIKMDGHNRVIRLLTAFLVGFFVGGLTEYLCSYFQEQIFGTVSWNYTYLKFNLNGRTSLFHSSFWGLAGVLFYEVIMPIFKHFEMYLKEKKQTQIIALILSTILLFDCTISTVACLRHTKRKEGELPQNQIEELLDRHYPDEYLNKIYTNAREPKRN